jgi:hypothetical protein
MTNEIMPTKTVWEIPSVYKIAEIVPAKTVRECALDHLCTVDFYEDRAQESGHKVDPSDPNGRSVGFPYDYVLDRIREEFPLCNTTIACLRWYAVKVRAEEEGYEGWRLTQRRPRQKVKKAAKVAT